MMSWVIGVKLIMMSVFESERICGGCFCFAFPECPLVLIVPFVHYSSCWSYMSFKCFFLSWKKALRSQVRVKGKKGGGGIVPQFGSPESRGTAIRWEWGLYSVRHELESVYTLCMPRAPCTTMFWFPWKIPREMVKSYNSKVAMPLW